MKLTTSQIANDICTIIRDAKRRVQALEPAPVYIKHRSEIKCADEAQSHIDSYFLNAPDGDPIPLNFD